MRCKKSIAQSTCKHCKRDQQIKYRPPPRGSPGCAAIGPLFLSHSGAKGKRAAESLVCESLSDFQGSSLLRAFTRRLRLGKGCGHGLIWPCAAVAFPLAFALALALVLLVVRKSLALGPYRIPISCGGKEGLGPCSLLSSLTVSEASCLFVFACLRLGAVG